MSKYICTGDCGGVSDVPGVCEHEGCSRYGQPLTECDCASVHKCKEFCQAQKQVNKE